VSAFVLTAGPGRLVAQAVRRPRAGRAEAVRVMRERSGVQPDKTEEVRAAADAKT
jgi:hypothetical protein